MIRLFFLLVLAAFLSGCNGNPFRNFYPDSAELTTRGFARQGDTLSPHPLYCYHTLGDKMCYATPLKVDEQRLSGYYGPMPKQYE